MRKFLAWVTSALNNAVPESSLKNKFRACLYRYQGGLPVAALVKRGECVVQVGTPYIKTVDKLAKLVGKTGKVVIIEASCENVERLSSRVRNQKLSNVSIVAKGAWSKKGKRDFVRAKDPLDNRIADDNILHDNDLVPGGYIGKEAIDVDTIDNIAKELGVNSIDYISITVNGAELNVLKGMEKILDNTQRLFVKAHARNQENNKPINQEVASFLEQRGFKTMLTRTSPSVVPHQWGRREGDVFAWRLRRNKAM